MNGVSPAKLVVHGAPHPLTQAAFAFLSAIVDAVGGFELELITVARDPLTIAGERGLYLRSNTIDTLTLHSLARPDAPLGESCAGALIRRLDTRWRDLPTLTLEEALRGEAVALAFLAEHLGFATDARLFVVARSAFEAFTVAGAAYGEPFAYLDALDLAGAEDDLVMHGGRLYPTFACESGVPALIEGWMPPDMDGSWLVQPRGSLTLYLRERAVLLTCIFMPLAETVGFTMLVNGVAGEAMMRREEEATLLMVPLRCADGGGEARTYVIELFLDDPAVIETTGVKLRALRLDPIPARDKRGALTPAPAIQSPAIQDPAFEAPLSVAHLIDDRSESRTVVVAAGPGSADVDLLAITDTAPLPRLEGQVDRIHFDRIDGSADRAGLLDWATTHLSYRGVLTGAETSAQAALDVVTVLTRGDSRALTFVAEDANWVAFPMTYWKR